MITETDCRIPGVWLTGLDKIIWRVKECKQNGMQIIGDDKTGRAFQYAPGRYG